MNSWLVFGVSHIFAIRAAAEAGLIQRPCDFMAIGGATAVGLRNPNSQTQALRAFGKSLLPRRPGAVPVMHLGEVDCGFVIWYRAQKHGEAIAAQVEESIAAYLGFVERLLAGGYATVVLTGASLPTIRDGHDWGEIRKARREVTASLRERTQLTLEYNRKIEAGAARLDLPFIDIAPRLIDPESGVLADYYRHPDPLDHHLHPDRTGALWADALNALAGSQAPGS